MPENDEPSWPVADEDGAARALREQGGDGGATAQLPVPPPPAQGNQDPRTADFAVPNVTPGTQSPEEGPTSWFSPPSPQQPGARQEPRRPEPPQRPDQQRPDQRPPDRRSEQVNMFRPPHPDQRQPEQEQTQMFQPQRQEEQRPEQRRPDQRQEQAQMFQPWQGEQRQERQQDRYQQDQPWQSPSERPDRRPVRPESLNNLPQVPAAPHAMPMRIDPSGQFYPAEATSGADREIPPLEEADEHDDTTAPPPPPPPPEAPPAPKPKRKRRGILIGGFTLLVVIGLGIAASLPQVSNRLELPWAPNKPHGDAPQPVAVTRVLQGPDSSSPAPTAAAVAKALSGPAANSVLGELTGSVLDPASGEVLWNQDSGHPLTPASTTKLLTVAAALLVVDHGSQLSTKVVQGDEPGTVVLVGGGDPTLNSLPAGKDSIYPGAPHMDDLVAQVKKATDGAVKKVQVDVGAFAGPPTGAGWDPGDAPSTFAAPVVPVMVDGGRTNPTEEHSMRVAKPATVAAQKLAQGLGAQAAGTATAPSGAKVLGEVKSAPLTDMVSTLLQSSDNLLADVIARQTAIVKGDEPSFAGGAKATKDVLSQSGFDLTGVELSDGSGLSKLNKIPAKLLSQVLAVAAGPDGKDPRTAKLRPMLGGLPIAGGSGTLLERYSAANATKAKGWLRAKTGTLSGVNTLAGLVLDTDGRVLVFALMSSSGADYKEVQAGLDAVAATLRGCGCR